MASPVTAEMLAALLDEHGSALELFAAQWTAPEDCVQDAFLQLIRQPRLPDNLIAWLYRVVRNRAISLHRSAQRREKHERYVAENAASRLIVHGENAVDGHAISAGAGAITGGATGDHRRPHLGHLSYEQLATVMGISRSSAHRRYEEALSALRAQVGGSWATKNSAAT